MKKYIQAGAVFTALSAFIFGVWFLLILINLPDVSVLRHYRPAAATEVLDSDGGSITQFYDRKFRIWVPIAGLSDVVIHAVTTAEDDTFFGHKGVNFRATWDALVHDMKTGRFARGGSTITQQMIKNVLLSKEKTVVRKVREFILARRAEEILTKRRILEIYLNEVEWGEGIYGIEAASRFYFDKHAQELSAAEASLLAGMLPNPRYFNPYKRMDKARERQDRVLSNMLQAKLVTPEEYQAAVGSALKLRHESISTLGTPALTNGNGRPCYQKALEAMLAGYYGEHVLYREGITIRTFLDKTLQDELGAWDEAQEGKPAHAPDRILAVMEIDKVRAIVCAADDEAALRFRLDSIGAPYSEYEIVSASPDSIGMEKIVMAGQGEAAR